MTDEYRCGCGKLIYLEAPLGLCESCFAVRMQGADDPEDSWNWYECMGDGCSALVPASSGESFCPRCLADQLLGLSMRYEQVISAYRSALELCLAVIPGLEVRNWPPGHKMKADAIEAIIRLIK